ncbi:hypothetical protein FSP39_009903, partial [Pinctada imbricata]
FRHTLSNVDWYTLLDTKNSVDENVGIFTEKFMSVASENIPNIMITIRESDLPWISSEIKRVIRKRNRTRKMAKKSNNPTHWQLFRKLRNECVSLLRSAKDKYFENLCDKIKSSTFSSKDWWKLAKIFYNPNVSTFNKPFLTDDDLEIHNDFDKANLLNTFFTSQSPANIVKPLQTTVVPSIASLLSVTTTTQNPAQTLIAGQQAGIQNMTPLSIPNSSISNTVTISQNPIVSLTQIPAVGNPQSTTLSSISNIQQGVTPQGNLQQQGINPQAVMNLFQNIGMQQIQQSQGLNPMQTSNTVANFQPSTLMMPSAIPSNINQDGVSCVQLPQSNFGLSGPLPSLLGQCTPNFSGGNNQLPGFSLENMFQANQPKSGQLMQIVQGESQPGCVQIKNAMATQSCDISQPMNKLFTEQVATSQQGQVLLVPNLQLPMLQILGTNPAVNVSTEKQAFPAQFSQNTDLQGLINQLQSSLSQMGSPLGMVNMQQVVNNLTTGSNLTAMQLQTLQLQQQLLQQIQQLQGMQSLISQINLQNQGASTITTVANRNNIVMTTGDATSSNSAGKVLQNEKKKIVRTMEMVLNLPQ